ncbi:tetratricopeptide repeat protein, putative [Plasmodium berghei]|uniref:Tetratricopeptide repeat protein, putative n=2 Tax=Plasmodium berghei TaxID=5821 RepID=A0A509APF1_PLABA|nr:tetratricopeptide repeat protein, putative [Plasmodium berghei ANKA]CXI66323.1 tetratricopeptide repeat protein, putative [Plasmodium berghei]SCM24026.1 tetratricopeptide repeat protein, putative [Plasmodium berghei]SCN26889.1 tetratricopeptide repeat protein, putative [Plasmodium berghei]SCO61300.1 tetratricopeptide repeat protein, putative [Plasmodium berghei]SCO63310.1 tetratricopeptide repeat protein, putative [Plasmodium berghei]|eukprot:XP_034422505.1 tetratricopeptide repeat protein, putative [Plasmodium berghei ANKA]
MGGTSSRNLEYNNYVNMKLLEPIDYTNVDDIYFQEPDIQDIISKARKIRNCSYKESLDLYFKVLSHLKKKKENNSHIYKNVLGFEIYPQEIRKNNQLNRSCENSININEKNNTKTLSDNETISINKKIASIYNEIADLCCIHDYIEKSLFYYNKAYSYNPSKIDYIYKQGVLYQQTNDIDKAIHTFKIILSTTPNHIPTLFSLGNLYRYIDYNIALSYFEAILKIEPDNTEVLSLSASCYDHLGKLNKAISYQNKAVEINPDNFNHKKFAQRLIEMRPQN